MRVAILINRKAGTASDDCVERIRASAEKAGIEVDVETCEPAKLTERARELAASGVDAVVAAGGDGTINAVAQGLVGGEVPLGVLPLGTRNHFAQDLGVPLDLDEAMRALAEGTKQRIDVGEVNGHRFINNSSIGMYPEIVIERDVERRATKVSKTRAMIRAAIRVLRRFPLVGVRIVEAKESVAVRTPFVFIGNNEYSTNPLSLGKRAGLKDGHLSLYTVRCSGRFHLFRVMMRALFQKLDNVADFHFSKVHEVWIDLKKRALRVAVDGEVLTMRSPLHYQIRRAALPVLAPAPAGAPG